MTIKRFILGLLTIIALIPVILSLISSLNQPQIQPRIQLYQTNLVLHATEFDFEQLNLPTENNNSSFINKLIGEDPYLTAQNQYQEARKASENNILNLQQQLEKLPPDAKENLEDKIKQEQEFINELDIKIGLIQAQKNEFPAAQQTWENVIVNSGNQNQNSQLSSMVELAAIVKQLWNNPVEILPVEILPDAESQIKNNLDGWFEYVSLAKLYQIENRQEDLVNLKEKEGEKAAKVITKLAIIGGLPFIGAILGVGILIFLIVQIFLAKEKSILATNANIAWEKTWDWEIILQVLMVGFFLISQIVIPLLFGLLGFSVSGLSLRWQAVSVLLTYLLMSLAGLLILYFSIKPWQPLPSDWFKFKFKSNWVLWGMGGYLVALPLVLIVSLINQQIWQGQGGSNPLLFLALQAQDKVALAIFFFTASIAAPIFEEIMFRGFLLASLTRYLPVGGAIIVSSLIFAFAHVSFSEVLPLTTLGIILGFVYTRKRNLFAPIMIHSLWNSGTMLSLFILGSN